MKKIAVLIALAAFAATPAMAASKSKKKHESEFDKAMAQNEKNLSLVVQALPLILPTWSLPIYFKMQEDADKSAHGKKKKKH